MEKRQRYISLKKTRELRQGIISEYKRMQNTAEPLEILQEMFDVFIKPILEHYQPIVSPLANHNTNAIYRARKCIDGQPFDDIQQLYNAPNPSGRAFTTSDIPILYAASSIQTALSEIGAKIGDLINIASFDYTDIMDGKFWFVGELGAFYKSQEQSRYVGDERVVQKPFYAPPEQTHALVFTDSLINEIFSSLSTDIDKYVLNRYVIHGVRSAMQGNNELDGLVFLSVKDAPGRNFAIFDNAITKLNPRIVNLVKVTDIDDYGGIEYNLLEGASPKNGSLAWAKPEI